jgi:transposase-like protein
MSDTFVDVRVRVPADTYRALYLEAQRRRLDGAGELIGLMLARQPVPRRSPGGGRPVVPADTREQVLERIAAGEVSVRRAAAELGITRAAIHGWQRTAAQRDHAEHVAALEALGSTGRAPVPVPAVPDEPIR